MYNSNNIAERIKETAAIRDITVKDLLIKANLGPNTMSNFKKSMPKSDNLAKIADVLNCSVDYLLGRSDLLEVASEQLPEKEKRIISLYRNDSEIQKIIDRLLKIEDVPSSPIPLHPAKLVADDGNNGTTTPEDGHAKRKALGRKYDQEQGQN